MIDYCLSIKVIKHVDALFEVGEDRSSNLRWSTIHLYTKTWEKV